ncbi:D-Ala-D-Ala carboxypeptidase family metallohydrolase [Utexia brackfieldae]|uniref:D-Ala-D-Ala carboxypeptidase family metallohydrolase n=1 Tax=Utexia brackfieldae TaxID=3074108 RepID=UPI00370DB40A
MKLTENFKLSELTKSATASKFNIDNSVPAHLMTNIYFIAGQMEKVREALDGNPIIISSGFRCKELNNKVGGSATSAHTKGLAIDFTCPKFGTPRQICKRLLERGILFDKLILEFEQWVHIGYSTTEDRHQVLTAVKQGSKTVYLAGLV